jgi:hypothetical protein
MASRDSDSLYDLRTVKRNIRAGLLDRTIYSEFLESLPDMADNVMAPEEGEDEDAFEDLGSLQPGAGEDDANVVPDDSTASALPPVPSTVPATPAAPEAAPLPPQTAPETATASAPPAPAIEPDLGGAADPFADAPLPGQMQVPPTVPDSTQPASPADEEPDGD